ncbi:MAG: B12-binding domain-containing radical SAM protein [Candidatus Thorarchaeota archaeon]
MGLDILLVNPNRFQTPPVIPIGLEYLVSALEKHNHDVEILDLCFSDTPEKDLYNILNRRSFDIVGFTIRNIDSAMYFNNKFFLPDFKPLVQCVKEQNLPIVLGGSGFSAMPNEILDYLKADYGIIGPGEIIFPKFLELWQLKNIKLKLFDGWKAGVDKKLVNLRGYKVNYSQYLKEEGIVGFRTHTGCNNQCPYCIEANTRVHFKDISKVIEELTHLVSKGYNHFHTCDTEFNTDLKFSIDFCLALIEKNFDLEWALYMKPTPYNEKLFELLHKSNAYLITLSVDSDERIQKSNQYDYKDLKKIVKYCHKYDIGLAIDLLTGYPKEPLNSVKKMIDFFKSNRPFTVGISFNYRVYNHTPLATLIKEDPYLQKNLNKPYTASENFLEPIFYSQLSQETLEELIDSDDLFRIAGITPGVNYLQI